MKILLHGGLLKDFTKIKEYFKESKKIILFTDGKKPDEYYELWNKEFPKITIIKPNKNYLFSKKELDNCDGIIIGGGDMELFNKFYNNDLFKRYIISNVEKGVPIFGTSAGAMLLGKYFLLKGIENDEGRRLSDKMPDFDGPVIIGEGIGIVDAIIGAHATEREEIDVTKYIGNKTNKDCICIDEESYFHINGDKNSTFGKGDAVYLKRDK